MKESEKAALIFLNVVGCAIGWPLVFTACLFFLLLLICIPLTWAIFAIAVPLWGLAVAAAVLLFANYRWIDNIKHTYWTQVFTTWSFATAITLICRLGLVIFPVLYNYNSLDGALGLLTTILPEIANDVVLFIESFFANFVSWVPLFLAIDFGLAIFGAMSGFWGKKVYPDFRVANK